MRYDVSPAEQRALLPGFAGLRRMGYALYGTVSSAPHVPVVSRVLGPAT